MKNKTRRNAFSLFLCAVLSAAMVLSFTGCNEDNGGEDVTTAESETQITIEDSSDADQDDAQDTDADESAAESAADVTVLGEGQVQFNFEVTDKEGNLTAFEIHTDKTTVGEALVELGLIAGDESEYGLYVKTVNGVTADYDVDGTYWAFYIDGEYAMTGVDSTDVAEGAIYSFKCES